MADALPGSQRTIPIRYSANPRTIFAHCQSDVPGSLPGFVQLLRRSPLGNRTKSAQRLYDAGCEMKRISLVYRKIMEMRSTCVDPLTVLAHRCTSKILSIDWHRRSKLVAIWYASRFEPKHVVPKWLAPIQPDRPILFEIQQTRHRSSIRRPRAQQHPMYSLHPQPANNQG